MKNLDRILEILRDSNWHRLEEINVGLSLPADGLNKSLRFLLEWGFIEEEKGAIRITPDGLEYLELPI